MTQAVIVSAARTPIAKDNGALKEVPPEDLAALVIKAAIQRAGIADPAIIDEVVFGNCFGGLGCIARVALLRAGLPMSIPGIAIDRQCGSGSTAVNLAAAMIQAGAGRVYVAGGVESMTRAPYLMEKPPIAYQREPPHFIHPPQLTPGEMGNPAMGITAETVAERWNISREEQDEFATYSQMKAARALTEGRFNEQIAPVSLPQKKGAPIIFDTDEHPRPTVTREQLAKLAPAFKPGGTVTAGNSSAFNDGAGALVLMSDEQTADFGIKPMAVVKGFASVGVDPHLMGIGPVPATRKLLERTGLTIADLDVIELNEAFASQSIACCRDLEIDWRNRDCDKLNPNGGAIALGHPIAASLAILIIKAIYELARRQGRFGLITACVGGGQGIATLVERV
ncbi:MAG: thiolase family protein [Chloroflexi bacterium]|nr:thiolase family protein [Chloroflexota bacterium]